MNAPLVTSLKKKSKKHYLLLKGVVIERGRGGRVKERYPGRGCGLSELEENQNIFSPNSGGVKLHPHFSRYQD